MVKNIAVIPGDGIGPEIVEQAVKVLNAVGEKFGHTFNTQSYLMGGAAIDEAGTPLPDETLNACLKADAVLLGAVGGPKWESLPGEKRPEKGLLGLRKGMGLYANLRPAKLFAPLAAASPLRADIANGIDFIVVRELIGGVYFGEHKTWEENGEKTAHDIMAYSESEIERIMHTAFNIARQRAAAGKNPKVTSVDKANVLDTSRLWRAVAERVKQQYPEVAYENMLVDNAAMQLVRAPAEFDVMVTENMFGDILSDEAGMITGSIGMLPSASLGAAGTPGLFEPIHGSAPDIAGKDAANPIGTILSVAMMLQYAFDMPKEAAAIENAVSAALVKNLRTADTMSEGMTLLGCRAMGEEIAANI